MSKMPYKWVALVASCLALLLAPLTFAQISPSPDLVPTGLAIIPETAVPGDVPAVRATIANRGNAEAADFWVNVRSDSQVIASQFVSQLAPNEEVQVEGLFVISASTRYVEVVADSTGRVAESDESNNTFRRQIDFAPDLVVEQIELDPPFPKPSEQAAIRATLVNTSSRAIDRTFFVRFLRGRFQITELQVDGLGAGQTLVLEAPWTANGGEQVIRVLADAYQSIQESDEVNNLLLRVIDITTIEPTGADLMVSDLQLSPANPRAGEVVNLQATITNNGAGAASAFKVLFQSDGFEFDSRSVPSLAPGESTTVTAVFTAEDAERLLRVKADSDGVIAESDETNNVTTRSVDSGEPLDACGQYVWLNVEPESIANFVALTGMTEEAVRNVFLPQVKTVMEQQYQEINVQVRLNVPPGARATITFNEADRGNILGQAPLGARYSVGFVYMGSFTASSRGSSLLAFSLAALRVIIATVASHELGHLFGLGHTGQNSSDIMSANVEVTPQAAAGVPQFAPSSRQQLERLLPFCS